MAPVITACRDGSLPGARTCLLTTQTDFALGILLIPPRIADSGPLPVEGALRIRALLSNPLDGGLEVFSVGRRVGARVRPRALEEILIVRVPSEARATIAVEVEIAAVGPLLLRREAAQRHTDSHDVQHPLWKSLRRHLNASIGACA